MSAWTVRPATLADAMYVYDHIWERGALELEGYGINRDRWLATWEFMTLIPDCACAFVHDDRVIAVLGAMRNGNTALTWFQATVDFDRVGAGLTRQMRRSITDLAKRAGVKKAALNSLCVSDLAPRWFKALGFTENTAYPGPRFGAHVERNFVRTWS